MSTIICPAISYDMPCLFELGDNHCPYCDRVNLSSRYDVKFNEVSQQQVLADEKKSLGTVKFIGKPNFPWGGLRSALEIIREARLLQDPSKEPDLTDVDPQGLILALKHYDGVML
jgi:hypothetical protein